MQAGEELHGRTQKASLVPDEARVQRDALLPKVQRVELGVEGEPPHVVPKRPCLRCVALVPRYEQHRVRSPLRLLLFGVWVGVTKETNI